MFKKKFNVGDEVRIIGNKNFSHFFPIGETGTIIALFGRHNDHANVVNKHHNQIVSFEDIELVKSVSKEDDMTDRKMLEELYRMAIKLPNFVAGNHIKITKNVEMYVDLRSFESDIDIEHKYFTFSAQGFEITHDSIRGMDLETIDMQNFSEFKFDKWAQFIEKELTVKKTVIVDGRTYKLVEDEEE